MFVTIAKCLPHEARDGRRHKPVIWAEGKLNIFRVPSALPGSGRSISENSSHGDIARWRLRGRHVDLSHRTPSASASFSRNYDDLHNRQRKPWDHFSPRRPGDGSARRTPGLSDLLPDAAKLALDCIGNSDALYHNVEHTMLVTLAGHDILTCRALLRPTTAGDDANFILGCLVHDIGMFAGFSKATRKTASLPTSAAA